MASSNGTDKKLNVFCFFARKALKLVEKFVEIAKHTKYAKFAENYRKIAPTSADLKVLISPVTCTCTNKT